MKITFPHIYLFKPVSRKTVQQNKAKGICVAWGCSRLSSPGTGHYLCNTCHSRLYRIRHLKRYAFTMIRDCAKRRGISFELTFEELLEFDRRVGYFSRRSGQDHNGMTLDRINPLLPYRADNIRLLKWIDNSSRKVDGMKQPWEPIARELALVLGDESRWKEFEHQATACLHQVKVLLEAKKENEPDEETWDDGAPF